MSAKPANDVSEEDSVAVPTDREPSRIANDVGGKDAPDQSSELDPDAPGAALVDPSIEQAEPNEPG
jgi:hypothetical protein